MKNHVVEYYYTKKKESEYFVDQNGKLHREDGPAYLSYYKDGSIKKQEYYMHGKLHRLDGPTEIMYYKDGKIEEEVYWQDNKFHRENGPAFIRYNNGRIESEEYWIRNKLHRLDGPACIYYNSDGNITYQEHWLNGIMYEDVFKWMVAIGALET